MTDAGLADAVSAAGATPVTYRIALIPGDGVGPEVIDATVSRPRGRRPPVRLRVRVGPARRRRGGRSTRTASPAGPRTWRRAATRTPCSWAPSAARSGTTPTPPSGPSRPCSPSAAASGCSRTCARSPSSPSSSAPSPLRPELLEGVDCLILRELTSGLYFGKPSEQRVTPEGRAAIDTLWYTEAEIRRIVTLAFELARTRRRKVTQVDKANVLATSRLWRRVTDEVHADFPDVELEHRLVDSAAMSLAKSPAAFDVLVTENLFGDILSDEAAVIAGSLGLLPSASHRDARDGARPPRPVRADPRVRARHRGQGPREPAGDDPVGRDDAPLVPRPARRRRGDRGRGRRRPRRGLPHRRPAAVGRRRAAACTRVGTREMARVIGDRIAI